MIGSQHPPPEPTESEPKRPLSSVEVVVFALIESRLSVLLAHQSPSQRVRGGAYTLPGQQISVADDADLMTCARKTIRAATGVNDAYCEQLGSWGSAKRDPRGWAATHVYLALLPSESGAHIDGPPLPFQWHAVDGAVTGLPLALDHSEILAAAVQRLRGKSEYSSIAAFLAAREFTLSELQQTFELVLGRPLEKKAFRTRLLATDLVQALDCVREAAHRPAMLYRLRDRKSLVFFPRPLQRSA
jgi:hypothetical protein